uniref:Uncharacterized protein n=1 Tax=Timema douglasi TaxID=61478 RepID=A0A7R8Z2M8_TIMDO|nr:unnamed protein product [Timema douglasi]
MKVICIYETLGRVRMRREAFYGYSARICLEEEWEITKEKHTYYKPERDLNPDLPVLSRYESDALDDSATEAESHFQFGLYANVSY